MSIVKIINFPSPGDIRYQITNGFRGDYQIIALSRQETIDANASSFQADSFYSCVPKITC